MLTRLKAIFDQIEIYHPYQNIGLRSLKNIGVWLCIYALTDHNDQEKIIYELIEGINANDKFDEVKKLVTDLTTAGSLEQIIKDYELSSGGLKTINSEEQARNLKLFEEIEKEYEQLKNLENRAQFDVALNSLKKILIPDPIAVDQDFGFKLITNSEINKEKIKEKAISYGMNFLISHLQVDEEQKAEMLFQMKNQIKYVWASNHYTTKASLNSTTGLFNQEIIQYLEANSNEHAIDYNLIEYQNFLFHVVKLSTLQDNIENRGRKSFTHTAVYLIEPVNKQDAIHLQANYLAIIDLMESNYQENHRRTYQLIADYQDKFPNTIIDVLKVDRNLHTTSIVNNNLPQLKTLPKFINFYFSIKFPKLSEPLKTEENRLGIYRYFQEKNIACIPFDSIIYHGQRELNYDEVGGEIKNLEAAGFILESGTCHSDTRISIQHTINNPFLFVYESPNKSDYYAYMIADPKHNLIHIFDASQSYPIRSDIEKSIKKPRQEKITDSPYILWHASPSLTSIDQTTKNVIKDAVDADNKGVISSPAKYL